MGIIFEIVAGILYLFSEITGLTYKEINIIVYYILIPYSYFVLIDYIFGKHYLKTTFAFIVLVILINEYKSFENFSDNLFDKSALFLNSFGFLGMDYYVASVVICVLVVIFIYIFLISIIINKRKKLLL